MTAVSLYDGACRRRRTPGSVGDASLIHFVKKLIEASLADFVRIGEYERQFAWSVEREPAADLLAMRSVWRLYFRWADEAEQILARADALNQPRGHITGLTELNNVYGQTRARLMVTPEQIARAKEQVRQGQIVPAKELRDELHARIRP